MEPGRLSGAKGVLDACGGATGRLVAEQQDRGPLGVGPISEQAQAFGVLVDAATAAALCIVSRGFHMAAWYDDPGEYGFPPANGDEKRLGFPRMVGGCGGIRSSGG